METWLINEKEVFNTIAENWTKFMTDVHAIKCVVGISGGIDSTCVAALACNIFGKDNVIGVSLPCNGQKDAADVDKVFEHLKIKRLDFDIGDAFYEVLDGVANNGLDISDVTRTNLPARLRMTALYAIAQSIPSALVINTCNLSETLQNYDTLWGDDCGSYAPIKELTKTEVRKLAKFLKVPDELVMKTPVDGLQDYTDEERFGYSYDVLDNYIRTGKTNAKKSEACMTDIVTNIMKRYNAGKFKIAMVNIVGPEFGFPDHIQGKNI